MGRGDRIESELEKGSERAHLPRMQKHAYTFALAILKHPHKISLNLTYLEAWIMKTQKPESHRYHQNELGLEINLIILKWPGLLIHI